MPNQIRKVTIIKTGCAQLLATIAFLAAPAFADSTSPVDYGSDRCKEDLAACGLKLTDSPLESFSHHGLTVQELFELNPNLELDEDNLVPARTWVQTRED